MQLNVTVSAGTVKRLKIDAIQVGAKLGSYAEKAFEHFLSLPRAERRRFFSLSDRKILGRKITP